ncbi:MULTISPECIES: hypothetical protein [unclassified Pseudomonas]|uniref:hypothetical protein n=1 Tax=unclassified Pseudomonas TaxID=196821 RepID=UPI0012681E1C|nr:MULTISPECIES: hypothetical protein [unclassified Pseudomonas]
MFKKILFHALVGGAIFVVGACLHDFAKIRGPGEFLAYGGMIYAGVTTLLILLGVNLPSKIGSNSGSSFLGKVSKDFSQKKARQELLEYKKLLDESVLTQDEFDAKAAELKKKIL